MSSLTLQDLLDSGISLEEILLNKNPVKVDVSVDTDGLMSVMEQGNSSNIQTLNDVKTTIISNNKDNKDLLIKALSLVIKESRIAAANGVSIQREITGLKMIRNKQTQLLEFIKLVRD